MFKSCCMYFQRRPLSWTSILQIGHMSSAAKFLPASCWQPLLSTNTGHRNLYDFFSHASFSSSSTHLGSTSETQNYYSVLKISPKATDAQIKTAFYRLSIIHHPDKNSGSSNAQEKFSEIAEAYRVLGNKKLRKEYDRKLSAQTMAGTRSGATNASRMREFRERGLDHSFDTWTQRHYNEARLRKKRANEKKEGEMQRKQRLRDEVTHERLTFISLCALIVAFLGFAVLKKGSLPFR